MPSAAGVIGGEWSIGGIFVAEEWPEDRRKDGRRLHAHRLLLRILPRALANYFIGARYGWRVLFMFGGVPALLVSFIRYGVHESARWEQQIAAKRQAPTMLASLKALFSPKYARRTILNSLFLLISIVGLWAGSVHVPTSVTQLAVRAGYRAADAARLASYGTMVLSAGTILGCIILPPLAERYGRRMTMAMYFALMFLSIAIGFGYVFYLPGNALKLFFAVLFSSAWVARISRCIHCGCGSTPTECRERLCLHHVGRSRFAGAGITFLVGAGVQ